ncbi:MAG: UvrD-helicase domain-containing protein, partial [Bacteroidota bacterium]|nr:UvrD-helicase domain-containing protein [Bacteroidota bacterium]
MQPSNTFIIYNASAGSGKTFNLVKEYLILLLNAKNDDTYKNILAITFTNKAVNEMK